MLRELLEPVAAGQTRFRLQGVAPDARGIAIGREALLTFDSLDRLVAFLGAYSAEASLDELLPSLTVERGARVGGGHSLLVRCSATDGYALDRLSRLAGAVRGDAWVGAGSVFVRTRERRAPFGYDLALPISELGGSTSEEVLVVDVEHSSRYQTTERIDPVELILRLQLRPSPLPIGGLASDPEMGGLRDMVLLLVAPGIADRAVSYLWHTQVAISGVRVKLEGDDKTSLLLRIRQPSPRILDVLHAIPGVELLAPISPRAAVEVGWRHPIHLASAGDCLPGDEMYVFRGAARRVERFEAAPRFVDGRHLVQASVELDEREPAALTLEESHPLRVELRLRRTSSPREPRATLVDWSQLDLLRRLVYVLPPSALAAARVLPLDEGVLVLSSAGPSSGNRRVAAGTVLPLGRRLVEVAPGVLVPDGFELWPRVRPALVRRLLGLEGEDRALFLPPEDAEDSVEARPMRLPAERFLALDAAVLGTISADVGSLREASLPALEPGQVENERLGRFALWGYKGDET